jgi:uncharacterized membrane protein
MKVTKLRSVIKTLTWRTIASLDTFLITWIVTGNPKAGITVSLIEVITKMGLYFFHERTWLRTKWGIIKENENE